MSELINLFGKLNEFYDNSLTWEQIAEKYEKAGESAANESNGGTDGSNLNTESPQASANAVTEIEMILCALRDSQVLSTLLELCSSIRNLRESNTSYDNTYDCWDQVVKVSPRDSYLAFIYGLTGLVTLNVFNTQYNKLAVAAANTYLLSLTIPGAKGFHIFEEEIIAHVLQVFILIDKIQNPNILRRIKPQQSVEIWVNFVTLCDDLKLLLRYVHFSEHKTARDHILRKLIDVQFQNHEKGFANICESELKF